MCHPTLSPIFPLATARTSDAAFVTDCVRVINANIELN